MAPKHPAQATRGNLSARQWQDLRQAARNTLGVPRAHPIRPDCIAGFLTCGPELALDKQLPASRCLRHSLRLLVFLEPFCGPSVTLQLLLRLDGLAAVGFHWQRTIVVARRFLLPLPLSGLPISSSIPSIVERSERRDGDGDETWDEMCSMHV